MGATALLDGVWLPVSAELSGEAAPAMVLERTEFELRDGRYWVRFGNEVSDRGLYSIDADTAPAQMMLRGTNGPNAGRVIPSIFKLTDAALTVCYGLDGIRPGAFATSAGGRLYLVHYRRHAD